MHDVVLLLRLLLDVLGCATVPRDAFPLHLVQLHLLRGGRLLIGLCVLLLISLGPLPGLLRVACGICLSRLLLIRIRALLDRLLMKRLRRLVVALPLAVGRLLVGVGINTLGGGRLPRVLLSGICFILPA